MFFPPPSLRGRPGGGGPIPQAHRQVEPVNTGFQILALLPPPGLTVLGAGGHGQGLGVDRAGHDPGRPGRFEASFNRSITVREADPRIRSNAGLVLLREADHRLGRTSAGADHSCP